MFVGTEVMDETASCFSFLIVDLVVLLYMLLILVNALS